MACFCLAGECIRALFCDGRSHLVLREFACYRRADDAGTDYQDI
jgi:hypothetical protein